MIFLTASFLDGSTNDFIQVDKFHENPQVQDAMPPCGHGVKVEIVGE